MKKIIILFFVLHSCFSYSQCLKVLVEDLAKNSKEFKTLVNEKSGFKAWQVLAENAPTLRTDISELSLVSQNLEAIEKAGGYTKWKSLQSGGNIIGTIVKNGNKIEYTNPAGTLIKWEEQLEQGISTSIVSKKASSELGDIVEGKVGEFVQSNKKVEGFNQVFKNSKGETVAELDVITADEIIECKRTISLAKEKFIIDEQAGRIANSNSSGFVNPYNKRKILYVDKPLARNASGELFPSDKLYIDELKDKGIDFANSLEELKKLLK